MGNSPSVRFKTHLTEGDEFAALHLYNTNYELRKAMDCNKAYPDDANGDSPLQLASRSALRSLVRIFLYDHRGNPNKKNKNKQTSLHLVCINKDENDDGDIVLNPRRVDCIDLMLEWMGETDAEGYTETLDLGAQDNDGNTALHLTAKYGLKTCMELLVVSEIPLFIQNNSGKTAHDVAEKHRKTDLALYLYTKMEETPEDEKNAGNPQKKPKKEKKDNKSALGSKVSSLMSNLTKKSSKTTNRSKTSASDTSQASRTTKGSKSSKATKASKKSKNVSEE